jgi:3alpha(or 20beta)-hydroxysteroid dehydrogenase
MAGRLSGKVAIVTGGTRGMGEAIVRGIVAESGKVVFGGRDEAAGNAIASDLGNGAYFVRQDVALEEDWRKIVAAALQKFGRINGLVNNAGSMGQHGVSEITMDLAQSLFATNQLAVLLGIKHVVGPMRSIGSGSIVNIGSVAVRRGMARISAYSGVKSAVSGITRSTAMELAPENIRVNAIHPGTFDTRMLAESMGADALAYAADVTPMNRAGNPREMTGPVVFLLSDESSYVTGAELPVDGGLSL